MTDNTTEPAHELNPQPAHVEAKAVALLILMAALVVGFVMYVMYARGVFDSTQRLVLVAEDSEGVTPGMDVTFAGFPIGRVQKVDLDPAGKVNILVDVPRKDARWLRESSVFTVERSIVGETRIRAYSGVLTDPPLPENARRTVLRGDAAAEIPRLMATARTLLENLETMTRDGSPINDGLANIDKVTGTLSGKYGLLGGALGGDDQAKKLMQTLDGINGILAKTDQRVFAKGGVMDDTQAAVVQLRGVLEDARGSLKKVDAVLVEAQAVGANARVATQDLGSLRGEVDASLRKVDRLVDELNRKWPFAKKTEIKLP
jgi:phospholipid/cholesterol/gamma-HCH transport system substrate-binding protein